MTEPRYKHDCGDCFFQGSYREYDVWVHRGAIRDADSLIARRSGEGSDYSSSPRSVFLTVVGEHVMARVGNYDVTRSEEQKLPYWMEAVFHVLFFQ